MRTARAQPFSINIIDGVKPFASPRPARKPRAKSPNLSTSANRKTATPSRADAAADIPATATVPERTTHYALRLEPIRLGPSGGAAAVQEPVVTTPSHRSRQSQITEKLRALARPVTLAAGRREAIIWCASAFAISLGVTFTSLHGAIGLRQRSEARMSQIERQIAIRTHNVAVHARDISEAHAIDNTNMGARDLDRVLADLAWTEAAKSPDARLQGWSWSPDQFTADANRPAAFDHADRSVKRRKGSVKRGLWSFAITQSAPGKLSAVATSSRRSW